MHLFRVAVMLLAVSLFLTACGSSRVVRDGTAQAGASTPRPGQTVTVKRGDTVYRQADNSGDRPREMATW